MSDNEKNRPKTLRMWRDPDGEDVDGLRRECAAEETAWEKAYRLGIANITPPEHVRTIVDRVMADLGVRVQPDDPSRD